MIRKLYLENPSGHRFHFDNRSGTLITAPSGLGFSQELTYLKYDTFYDRVDQTQPLSEIQATLVFLKGYRGYSEFLEYIQRGDKGLKLFYEASEIAFCYIDIKSLSKQELFAGTLQCQIVIHKLSLWLKSQVFSIVVNGDLIGKVYPFGYPFRYSASYEGKILVQNRGVQKAPLFIEMIGSVDDPEVLIRRSGTIVSTLRLYHSQTTGEVHISALPSNQYIHSIDNGETISIYASQDFTCDNFLFIEPGECEIEFKPGVASSTFCRITMLEGYLGV
jgi:hypothetical protein